ncbi:MAG TPA: OmpH family outer membrane protein [Gemmata sp.]|nr:OmpH family outer membrane protein [Gemmata sp.]
MVRWNVLAAAVVVVVGGALVTGASDVPKASPDAIKTAAVKGPVPVLVKTGYFNMAKVMREYPAAKQKVEKLNEERNRMTAKVAKWKEQLARSQQEVNADPTGKLKAERAEELIRLTRKIEDEDRRIAEKLNKKAKDIIASLYDGLHDEVEKMAKEKGLAAVLAYPDAFTPEDLAKPEVKELKLKPPAAQPFYIDPSVEYTDELIRRLKDRHEAEEGK